MKKMFFTLLFVGVLVSAVAQNDFHKGFTYTYETRICTVKFINSPFTTVEYSISNGYRFSPYFALRLPVEAGICLLDGENRTYEKQITLGLNAAYTIPSVGIEFAAMCGSTLTNKAAWQYRYYDFGVKAGRSNSLYYSIGVRRYQTYGNSTVGPKTTFYAAIGFWFN